MFSSFHGISQKNKTALLLLFVIGNISIFYFVIYVYNIFCFELQSYSIFILKKISLSFSNMLELIFTLLKSCYEDRIILHDESIIFPIRNYFYIEEHLDYVLFFFISIYVLFKTLIL